MPLLEVSGVRVSYGPVRAVDDVNLDVDPGEVVALVGSNGAGKSTMLKAIIGLLAAQSGRILFDGRDITGMPPAAIVGAGISLSPEGRRVFAKMSVHENLLTGAHLVSSRRVVRSTMERVFVRFPRLRERRSQLAGSLSGGEQQMLAIGRALMAQPKLLLLDEPFLGLAPIMFGEIGKTILELSAEGISVLLVEQNANIALRLCNRGFVMENASIVLTGSGRELASNKHVQESYLGLPD
jgi:branched-chain amino acid transport system ATP-binding protein